MVMLCFSLMFVKVISQYWYKEGYEKNMCEICIFLCVCMLLPNTVHIQLHGLFIYVILYLPTINKSQMVEG